jgi:restriction system protein
VEQIEQGVSRLTSDVAAQLLKRLRDQQPAFLEQAVLDLLVEMQGGDAVAAEARTVTPARVKYV